MTQFEPGTGQKRVRWPRAFRLRGAEPLEFTLVLPRIFNWKTAADNNRDMS